MRRFDPENTLKLIADNKADMLVAVPTMLTRMLALPAETIAKYDTSSLRSVVVAGSAVSPELSERFQDTFGDVLYNVYGSTEVAVATVATPTNLRTAPGTVGKPPVLTTVRLYDENNRLIEGVGTRGRVFVRAGAPFEGYSDGRTKQIIDGHLSPGDMGHWDEHGLLHIDGRDDDMIVSGGENVYPLEVENLLVTRDDVVEAAVIGVPDSRIRPAAARVRGVVRRCPRRRRRGADQGSEGLRPRQPGPLQGSPRHRLPGDAAPQSHRQDRAPRAPHGLSSPPGSSRSAPAGFLGLRMCGHPSQ